MEDASFLNNKGILEECLGPGCSEHDLPKGVGQRQFSNSPPLCGEWLRKALDLAALNIACLRWWIRVGFTTSPGGELLRKTLGLAALSIALGPFP